MEGNSDALAELAALAVKAYSGIDGAEDGYPRLMTAFARTRERRYLRFASMPSPCSCVRNPLRCRRWLTSFATSRPLVSRFGAPV